MNFFALIKSCYVEEPVADETLWHKCDTPAYPVDLVTGGFSWRGQLWRRKVNGKWEYQQDAPTPEDVADGCF
jgi:hypothetical protein